MTTTTAPGRDEAAEYYFTYIALVPPGELHGARGPVAGDTGPSARHLGRAIAHPVRASTSGASASFVAHLNDTERLFVFRAFWFARGFDSPLPSFDQNVGDVDGWRR